MSNIIPFKSENYELLYKRSPEALTVSQLDDVLTRTSAVWAFLQSRDGDPAQVEALKARIDALTDELNSRLNTTGERT